MWLAAGVACLLVVMSFTTTDVRVEWVASTAAPGPAEVFYANEGDFTADASESFGTISDGTVHGYRVEVPVNRATARLRLDPGTGVGRIESTRLSMRWRVLGIPSARMPLQLLSDGSNDVVVQDVRGGHFVLLSQGNDPFVTLALPRDAAAALRAHRVLVVSVVSVLAGLLWLSVSLLARRLANAGESSSSTARRLVQPLARLGARLSDAATVQFGALAMAFLIACVLGGALGVAANINQSSIEMWNAHLPGASSPDSTLVGRARAIRSDEWLVFTPWMLSQARHAMPVKNPSLGGGSTPLLTSMPTAHASTWVQPEFWGFALFGPERAIAWHWMFKLFGLLSSSFLLLMLLTRSEAVVSALGAAWLTWSSFTQWWFSAGVPEILIGFCLTMAGLLYIARAQRRAGIVGGAVMLVLGACTFALQMYPPFQIPLAWAGVAIVAGSAIDSRVRADFATRRNLRIAALAMSTAAIASVLLVFVGDARPTIDIMLDTAYPGRRVSVGGDLPWSNLFDGVFELWRFGEQSFPGGANASEASDFVLLFPAAAVVTAARWRQARDMPVATLLAAFCLLLAAWAVVPLPAGIATTLAKVTLMSFVPPMRSIAGLGAASILLCCMLVAWRGRSGAGRLPVSLRAKLGIAVAMLVAFQFGGWMLHADAGFMTGWRVLLGCTVVGLGTTALVTGRRRLLAVMVALVVAPGLAVNPVNQGLAPLVDKPVLAAARSVDDGGRWIAVGQFVLAQALKSSGLPTFGGATYVPDVGQMRLLDPTGESKSTWNRYAHIQVESAPGIARPGFTLVQADHYIVRLDICRDAPLLGVDRVAFAGTATAADLRCLQPVSAGPIDGITLYRLHRRTGGSARPPSPGPP